MADFRHKDLNQPFPWGPVVAVHRIGQHTIVEHHPKIFKDSSWTGKYDQTKTEFTCLLKTKSSSVMYECAETLDGALLVCIGHAHENSRAVPYAAQILGVAA